MNPEGAKDLGEDALLLTGFGADLYEKSVVATGMHSCLSVMKKLAKGHRLDLAHSWPRVPTQVIWAAWSWSLVAAWGGGGG